MSNYEVIWKPQPGPQTDLITCPVEEIFFGGSRGGGKALVFNALVATPAGWKEIGELVVGDKVISIDGTGTDVIGVWDFDSKPLYRVKLSDGGEVTASDDHNWYCVGKFAWRKSKTGVKPEGKKYTTLELLEKLKAGQETLIPVPEPVRYTQRFRQTETKLDPYAFGVLLGDGSTAKSLGYAVLEDDAEIIDKMEEAGFHHRVANTPSNRRRMIVGYLSRVKHREKYDFVQKVGGLLGHRSDTKFIPDHFLYGPLEERWAVLQGLMDTDGTVDSRGHIGLTTTSQKLADTTRHLVLSLGGIATVTGPHVKNWHKPDGTKIPGKPAWSVYIRFNDPSVAFYLPRKKERGAMFKYDGGKRPLTRRIVSIEPVGEGKCRCIAVRHASSLFLTEDFIATHNTDAIIGKFAYVADRYGSGAHGIVFRRTFKQLEEVLKRTRDIYPKLGATYSVTAQTWTFPNGATLKLRHLDNVMDAQAYQGHQYSHVFAEEITNWPSPAALDMLKGTLRSAAGVPTQFIATGNPGGPGHAWVKARYIDPARNGYTLIKDPESGLNRVYIPSKLSDNKILVANDPSYQHRLKQTGAAALVRAWLEGDWDIVAGGFFDDIFRAEKHILKPFAIPENWSIVVGFDWGFSAPSALAIFARVNEMPPGLADRLGVSFPRGSLIHVKEWYTVQKDESGFYKPNVGLKYTNEEIGAGIARRLKNLPRPRIAVADPSIFNENGGPSSYERMQIGAKQEGYTLNFTKADNNRQSGWSRMRELLRNAGEDKPEREGLWVFDSCENWLRTVPVLPADRLKPDDVDTDAEDHCADATRYACMTKSRVPKMAKFFGG